VAATALLLLPLAVPAAAEPAAFTWRTVQMPGNSHLSEPSLAVDFGGTVYVAAPAFGLGAGAGDPGETTQDTTVIYKSSDGGQSFGRLDLSDAVAGGLDNHVDVLPGGAVNVADVESAPLGVLVYHSTDGLAQPAQPHTQVGTDQDRPWLSHLCDEAAYFAYRDFLSGEIGLWRSMDGGGSWDAAPSLVSSNLGLASGEPNQPDTVASTISGPVAVDQVSGEIYVVYGVTQLATNAAPQPYGVAGTTLPNAVVVASSTDGGLTFTDRYVHAGPPGTVAGPTFPWITLDLAGNLYVGWGGNPDDNGSSNLYYADSTDHGQTWSSPVMVHRGGTDIYPTIAAGDPGVLDIAWYSTAAPPSVALTPATAVPDVDWNVEFAQVRRADTSDPEITTSRISTTPIHHGIICVQGNGCAGGPSATTDHSMLDFFSLALGPDGMAYVAWPDNHQHDPGSKAVWQVDNHLLVARQVGGAPAFDGVRTVCGRNLGAAAPTSGFTPTASPGAAVPGTTTGAASARAAWLSMAAGAAFLSLAVARRRRHP
jgi:hypothetical protein